jgi:ribosomal protein L29
MAKKDNTLVQKSVAELKETVNTLKNDLMKMKLDHAKRQLKQTSSLTSVRKQIARALTSLKEKEGMAKNG